MYEPNNVYCTDCYAAINELPDRSVDLIVTDPPYKIDAGGRAGCFGVEKRKYHLAVCKNDKMNCGVTNDILKEMCRVMKRINIYLWCNKNQLAQYLNFFENKSCNTDVLVWCKTNPIPTCNNKYVSDLEYCVFARGAGVGLNGTFETKRKWYVTPLNVGDKGKFEHPTIKPLKIIENLIINSSKEGDLIFDPFVGSGTTCVAAKNLGRKYLGFEISSKWAKIATDRLNNTQANGQLTMFTM